MRKAHPQAALTPRQHPPGHNSIRRALVECGSGVGLRQGVCVRDLLCAAEEECRVETLRAEGDEARVGRAAAEERLDKLQALAKVCKRV